MLVFEDSDSYYGLEQWLGKHNLLEGVDWQYTWSGGINPTTKLCMGELTGMQITDPKLEVQIKLIWL